MKEAAADLKVETATRLRDGIERREATELTIADYPLARKSDVEESVARTATKGRSTSGKPGTRARKYKKR